MPEQPARRPRKPAPPLPPPMFREVIVPRDENTQRVLSAEVNEWWQKLPLATRLGVAVELSELQP
jgi:hypothetical protein